MAPFPTRKNDILALAQKVQEALLADPATYPSPPFDPAGLVNQIALVQGAVELRQIKEGELAGLVVDENAKFDLLIAKLKQIEAQIKASYPDDMPKLKEAGYPTPAAPGPPSVPGQPRNLEATVQGPGQAELDWMAPKTNRSLVRFYRIERMIVDLNTKAVVEDWGQWEKTTTDTEIVLTGLPRGVEITFRVFAVGANGSSIPSNSVIAVL